jgi:hypothetical protein
MASPGASRILRLWAPLETAWLFMAVEGPFLGAILARLPDPTTNLAALGWPGGSPSCSNPRSSSS